MTVATVDQAEAPQRCRSGRHVLLGATVYVNPGTGARYCRPCYNERRLRTTAARRRGQLPPLRSSCRYDSKVLLTADELATLRAAVACLGCGAVRRSRTARKPPFTTITHGPGCRVRHNQGRGEA